jgi:hypothetical protein
MMTGKSNFMYTRTEKNSKSKIETSYDACAKDDAAVRLTVVRMTLSNKQQCPTQPCSGR